MQLQIALDRMDREAALDVAARVAPLVDWIEVGTSHIKRDGAAFLAEVVAAAGATPVLADLKTADDARWEFEMAYAAGAGSATVLGLASDVTIDTAVAVAQAQGREVVVDLMGVDAVRRGALAARLPGDVVLAAHVAKDEQGSGSGPLDQLGPWASGRSVAIAGGLGASDLRAVAQAPGIRAIVGSAVTSAPDPVAATLELLHALNREAVAR